MRQCTQTMDLFYNFHRNGVQKRVYYNMGGVLFFLKIVVGLTLNRSGSNIDWRKSVDVVDVNSAVVLILCVIIVTLLLRVSVCRWGGSATWHRVVERCDVSEVLVRVWCDTRHRVEVRHLNFDHVIVLRARSVLLMSSGSVSVRVLSSVVLSSVTIAVVVQCWRCVVRVMLIAVLSVRVVVIGLRLIVHDTKRGSKERVVIASRVVAGHERHLLCIYVLLWLIVWSLRLHVSLVIRLECVISTLFGVRVTIRLYFWLDFPTSGCHDCLNRRCNRWSALFFARIFNLVLVVVREGVGSLSVWSRAASASRTLRFESQFELERSFGE